MRRNKITDILDYWISVEGFTPYKVETSNKFGYTKSIQEICSIEDIAWNNKPQFKHENTESHTWIYTVFLGIIKTNDINNRIKHLLGSDIQDTPWLKSLDSSCICSFQVNINGKPTQGTLEIPDYFPNLCSLAQRDKFPKTWLNKSAIFKQKITDRFENYRDLLEQEKNHNSLSYKDMQILLSQIIDDSLWPELDEKKLIKNIAVIHAHKLPILKNKPKKDLVTLADSAIHNSFYTEDLQNIKTNNNFGKAFQEYMNMVDYGEKIDLFKQKGAIKEYSYPTYLSGSRWPVSGNYPLSIAQQIAVNLALKSDEGLFSINGPPGTGKSTLLKDIISGILLKRSKILLTLDNANDAFETSESFSIKGYNYKSWKLIPSLLGHEIVIASSNNSAVENISKEIPKLSEIDINLEQDVDYFSEIASYILKEDSWGLSASPLGNRKNCLDFFEKFWHKKPKDTPVVKEDHYYGLEYLLQNTTDIPDWDESKQSFKKTLNQYDLVLSELNNLAYSMSQLNVLGSDIFDYHVENIALNEKIEELVDKLQNTRNQLLYLQKSLHAQKEYHARHIQEKSSGIEYLIDIIFNRKKVQSWLQEHARSSRTLLSISNNINTTEDEINQIEKELNNTNSKIQLLNKKTQTAELEYKKCLDTKIKYQNKMGNNFPDDDFWKKNDKEILLSSPWLFEELHEIRKQLFIESLKLHKAFIFNSSKRLLNNLRCMHRIISSNDWPVSKTNLLPHVWSSFFMIVPVASTTFASFSTLFKGMGKESIGWLLIDEAGQASPQVATGAIYRSKRSIIVGDPLQIQPVVTIHEVMNDALLSYYNVSDQWNCLLESVQTVADRANIYGAFVGNSENKKWIGCPLRVHRRCAEPMFKVANEIAYNNLMIQATENIESLPESIMTKSEWIHVPESYSSNNWIKEEGKAVQNILSETTRELGSLPPIYIISPFRNVVFNMKQELNNNLNKWCHTKNSEREIISWVNKSVGTIHTFQGKESSVVILLLGGDSRRPGIFSWASKTPNLLNVAITRAKNTLIVVGNHDKWSKIPFFEVLANSIPKRNIKSSDIVNHLEIDTFSNSSF